VENSIFNIGAYIYCLFLSAQFMHTSTCNEYSHKVACLLNVQLTEFHVVESDASNASSNVQYTSNTCSERVAKEITLQRRISLHGAETLRIQNSLS